LNEIDPNLRREGVLRGGYIAKKKLASSISSSCRVGAIAARASRSEELGDGVRVVPILVFERFNANRKNIAKKSSRESCRKRRDRNRCDRDLVSIRRP
jgi:transketolase